MLLLAFNYIFTIVHQLKEFRRGHIVVTTDIEPEVLESFLQSLCIYVSPIT